MFGSCGIASRLPSVVFVYMYILYVHYLFILHSSFDEPAPSPLLLVFRVYVDMYQQFCFIIIHIPSESALAESVAGWGRS